MAQLPEQSLRSWSIVMSQALEQSVLLDLTEVLEEYARRQQELVTCLRTFRAHLVGPEWTPVPTQPPPPRFLEPPPPPLHRPVEPPTTRHPESRTASLHVGSMARQSSLLTSGKPAPVHIPATKATQAETHSPAAADSPAALRSPNATQATVRATRRDYDYFTELDEKLTRLWAENQVEGCSGAEEKAVE